MRRLTVVLAALLTVVVLTGPERAQAQATPSVVTTWVHTTERASGEDLIEVGAIIRNDSEVYLGNIVARVKAYYNSLLIDEVSKRREGMPPYPIHPDDPWATGNDPDPWQREWDRAIRQFGERHPAENREALE